MQIVRWWMVVTVLFAPLAVANDYATDFGQCSEHFWQGVPPATVFDPSGSNQYPLCFMGFATLYSGVSNTALYSAHHLTGRDIKKARKLPRKDSFRPETRLPVSHQSQLKDYKHSGYDRGHLVPNGDMPDVKRQYDSFSLANIVPQNSEQNRGVWQQIESHVRTLSERYGESYVVTGTGFSSHPDKLANMYIPSHLYKAIYLPSENIAVVYYSPNNANGTYELIDVAELQNRVGINVFPQHNPRFVPAEFELTSRPDNSQSKNTPPTANGDSNEGIWAMIATVLLALWQALG